RDAIRVVNVIGVGASSGGGFTMNALEQRIDPPPPQIPQPGTLLLISIGLVGLGCLRRRSSATSESSS
ncbi:PEP-CTERM sorting domain-containing protein, partial [Accumulibacter sp.]|uniref:PEP-CTERM sorting domain-containing protein n=1 Tax=Accumulibacter sp. TaxID=2053492 RepID=UPI001A54EE1C